MTRYTWKTGANGLWGTGSDWVGGAVPNSITADVTVSSGSVEIASGSTYTVDSITLSSNAATLDIQGLLNLGGTQDVLSLLNGTLDVSASGTIADGTINVGAGKVTLGSNAMLDAITYIGVLNITSGQLLETEGGFTVQAASGLPGTINIGDNATFDTETTPTANETLNGMVINLGAATGGATLEHDLIGSGGVLVLGSGVTINIIGANDQIFDDGSATIINDGVINVDGAGFQTAAGVSFGNAGTINIEAGASMSQSESTVTNAGVINVAAGASLAEGSTFSNSGTINVAVGATLTETGGLFSNSGAVDVNGGTLVLGGVASLSSLSNISFSGDPQLDVVGTLLLGGSTLGLTGGTVDVLSGATVANGIIVSGATSVSLASPIMLDAITYIGILSISSGQLLETEGGFTIKTASGKLPGTISIGDNATFDTETNSVANETLNSMVINLGAATGGATLEHDLIGSGGVLVLGSGVTINVIGANDRIFDDGGATVINDGVINVDGAGFQAAGGAYFGNVGKINIKAGDGFSVTTGTFTNNGLIDGTGAGTVTISILGSFTNLTAGILSAGSFEAGASDTLALNLPGIFTKDDANLILNGIGAEITEYDPNTSSFVSIESELAAIGSGGTLQVLGKRNYSTSNILTLSGGSLDLGGGTFTASGIAVISKGGIKGFGVVKANETGNVSLDAVGGVLDFSAGTLGFLTSTTLTAGSALEADVSSTLKLTANQTIVVDAASITLSGTNSVIESLNTATNQEIVIDSTLDDIAAGGALSLLTKRNFTAAANGGSFTNSGELVLGGGTFTAVQLSQSAGAVLTGFGTVAGPIVSAGSIIASGGTLAIAGAISGSGTLSAASKNVLDLIGGGSFAGAITGAGNIKIDGALLLNSGTSLSATSVLEDASVTLGTGTTITNSAGHGFTIAANSGIVTLGGSGTLTNAGTLSKTGTGEADIGATFINSASVLVGAGKMVFLGQVSGSGAISLTSGATAVFDTGASATQKVSFLAGSSTLDFGSPASFLGTIAGFTGSDKIDLLNTAATQLSYAGGVLTVLNGTTTVATLTFSGTYNNNNFVLGSDSNGGSLISWHA